MKNPNKRITLFFSVFLILLLVTGLSPVFSTGQQEKGKPTLVWFTSVQGGREPSEEPLFEKEVERLTGVKVKIIKTTENYNTKL